MRHPSKFIRRVKLKRVAAYANFVIDYLQFKAMAQGGDRFQLRWKERYPCLLDCTQGTGFDPHYTYHPAWAARILASLRPDRHVDVSSKLEFSTMVSAFIPVEFYDYRPANLKLNNLTSSAADLLALPFADSSIDSISCMHVIEHVGLGRYGDPLDPDGDLKAMAELRRVVAVDGSLLLVVPVGRPRILFNAHRIYSYQQILSQFPDFELRDFTLIGDDAEENGPCADATESLVDKQLYGCGCFWLVKKPSLEE